MIGLLSIPAAAQHKEYRLEFGDYSRRYLVYAPPEVGKTSTAPVVLLLHGGGGDANSLIRSAGMDAIADREKFIVVYPEGTGKKIGKKRFSVWNGGRCCGKAKEENVDDVGFLAEVIRRVKSDYRIDSNRVFMSGHSNGAIMSYRFACDRPDLITAIAPVGSVGDERDCTPTKKLSVLHIHGKLDECARFNGGKDCGGCFETFFHSLGLKRFKQKRHACESVPKHMVRWQNNLACKEESARVEKRGPASCTFYDTCKSGGTLGYCFVEGMGHAWPGATSQEAPACRRKPGGLICRRWVKTVGPYVGGFSASETIWEFFAAH